MSSVAVAERRVCVAFAGDHPVLYYRADADVAGNFSAAFADSADPVVTVDDELEPGLRPLPCARLFTN